jgi:hypothetical protein
MARKRRGLGSIIRPSVGDEVREELDFHLAMTACCCARSPSPPRTGS